MCRAFEEIAFEAAKEAAEKATHEKAIDTALKMIARGRMTLEEISEDSGLPLEEVKELAQKKPA